MIDRELITERVTRRGEKPSRGLIPNTMPSAKGGTWESDHPRLLTKPDVAEARRLMKEAGYGEGGKQLPPIEYSYNTSDEHKIIGEQLQAMWRDAFGVDVRLQNMENAVLQGRFTQGDFQMARSSWVADYPDPLNFLEIHVDGSTYNRSRLNNPAFDALILEAGQEPDQVKRDDILAEAERILIVEEAAVAPIYDFTFSILISDKLENVGVNNLAWINYVRSRRK
jgi:ABC-type oligopeptide transport system substrate-binding subunit